MKTNCVFSINGVRWNEKNEEIHPKPGSGATRLRISTTDFCHFEVVTVNVVVTVQRYAR